MTKIETILCLLGLPGSGKGTQGHLLHTRLDFGYFAAGDLVRDVCASKDKGSFHMEVRKRYESGIPQPDEVINKLVAEKALGFKKVSGLIIDAYPLSLGQAQGMKKLAEELHVANFYVLYLDIKEKDIVKRLSKRKICSKCQAPAFGDVTTCVLCGGELLSRADDKVDVIKRRVLEYQKRFKPILEYYQKEGKLIVVKADQAIGEVYEDILDNLKGYGITSDMI